MWKVPGRSLNRFERPGHGREVRQRLEERLLVIRLLKADSIGELDVHFGARIREPHEVLILRFERRRARRRRRLTGEGEPTIEPRAVPDDRTADVHRRVAVLVPRESRLAVGTVTRQRDRLARQRLWGVEPRGVAAELVRAGL